MRNFEQANGAVAGNCLGPADKLYTGQGREYRHERNKASLSQEQRQTAADLHHVEKFVQESNMDARMAQYKLFEGPLKLALDHFAGAISQDMQRQGFWESTNTGEKIALMHSELSEALEADRKESDAGHLEGFTGVEEELADTVIRLLDFAGYHKLRLAEAIVAKCQFNLTRPFRHGKGY